VIVDAATIAPGRPKRQVKRKRPDEDDEDESEINDVGNAADNNSAADDVDVDWVASESDEDGSWDDKKGKPNAAKAPKKARVVDSVALVAHKVGAADAVAAVDPTLLAAKFRTVGPKLQSALHECKQKFWSGWNRVPRTFTVSIDGCTQAEFEELFPAQVGLTVTTPKKTTVVTQRILDEAQCAQTLGKLDISVTVYDKGCWSAFKPTVRRGSAPAIVQKCIASYSTATKKITLKCDVINSAKKFKGERRTGNGPRRHRRGIWFFHGMNAL